MRSFHLLLPGGKLTSTTAVDWYLKVKNRKCDVGLTKNHCMAVSMHKTSSIHKLIEQILGPHELMTTPIFDQAHPKNH